jgi:hypothetical protein
MKNIISLFLCFIFSLPPLNAATTEKNQLQKAVDDLQYAITVEWDQKDQLFYNTQMEAFKKSLQELHGSGMPISEMVAEFAKMIKDEKVANEFSKTFNLIDSNKMSFDHAVEIMNRSISQTYQRGASWSGEAVLGISLVVIIMGAMTLILMSFAKNGTCIGGGPQEVCLYPNADKGDYTVVRCDTRDLCTGETYSTRYK